MGTSAIAAIDRNGLLGAGGRLPWRLPEDLRHFRRVTWGKPVLWGRVTFEAIGRPLPGRRHLVLSRRPWAGAGQWVDSLAAAQAAAGDEELLIAGGAQVYRATADAWDRLYLTVVAGSFTGDAWFPLDLPSRWGIEGAETLPATAPRPHAHRRFWLRRDPAGMLLADLAAIPFS